MLLFSHRQSSFPENMRFIEWPSAFQWPSSFIEKLLFIQPQASCI